MSTGIGGNLCSTKNKLWEATINGKTRKAIPFLNCIENPVCSGAIFLQRFQQQYFGFHIPSYSRLSPILFPARPPPLPLPSNAGWILSLSPIQDGVVLPMEYCARCHSTGMIMPCLLLGALKMGIIFLHFYFLQSVLRLLSTNNPALERKAVPCDSGTPLIHVTWDAAQSVYGPQDREGACSCNDLRAGWNESWEATGTIDSSTGLENGCKYSDCKDTGFQHSPCFDFGSRCHAEHISSLGHWLPAALFWGIRELLGLYQRNKKSYLAEPQGLDVLLPWRPAL